MAGSILNPTTPGYNPATTQPQGLSGAIPGLSNLTQTATGNIQNLLSGLPSASWARTTNAYNGVATGQPATGGTGTFQGNRGADLYHTQANQNQQTGLQDLLSLVGGYSGTVAPNAGQLLQNQQFGQQLNQNASQFDQQNSLAQMNTLLQSLGIMNQF